MSKLGKEQLRLLALLQKKGPMRLKDIKPYGVHKRVMMSLNLRELICLRHTIDGIFMDISPLEERSLLQKRALLAQQGYRAKDGVICQGDRILACPEADRLARSVGLPYAEYLVEFMKKGVKP